MAVLVEAISVIIRVDAIEARHAGGFDAFEAAIPNETACSDGELVRVGFMAPADVEAYVGALTAKGLRYVADGVAHDIVVVDQQRGPLVRCEWLEAGRLYLAAVLDLFSRKVVGWAMAEHLGHDLALAALERAIANLRPVPGLVHHSDRGVQYAAHGYRRLAGAGHALFHEPQGRLLGQRADGKLLRHAERRVGRTPRLSHPRRGTGRRVPVYRRLLKSAPSPFRHRVSHPGANGCDVPSGRSVFVTMSMKAGEGQNILSKFPSSV